MAKSPEAYAFEITRTIQAALGPAAYPLSLSAVIAQFAPIHAPGAEVEIVFKPLNSIEGALIRSSDGKAFTILVNSDIGSQGRANFTLAHEFGHLLLHRDIGSDFWCNSRKVLGLTSETVETQANRFASQLVLPNNFVRYESDKNDVSLASVKNLANRMGASLSATALAMIAMSKRPLGFVVVRDGFIDWGRASDSAFKQGLFFKSGNAVPETSAASFEGGSTDQVFALGHSVDGWSRDQRWKEQGFYSARYGSAFFLLTQ